MGVARGLSLASTSMTARSVAPPSYTLRHASSMYLSAVSATACGDLTTVLGSTCPPSQSL